MSDNSRVRVSIVGVVIVALFGSLLARLWFLQMGPERALGAEAINLSTRTIQTESPRGRILDRYGNVLAQDRAAWAVTVDRNLGTKTHARVMGQLSELLGIPLKSLQAAYDSQRQSPLQPAVVALDVSLDKRLAVLEHQDEYPGVHVAELTVRTYPTGDRLGDPNLAAQVLGYVGEIGADQLKRLGKLGYQAGDLIGRDGIESAYESELRGRPEQVTVDVDPTGKQIGPPVKVDPGSVGHDVVLTIDARLQLAAERALAGGILAARTQKDQSVTDHYATLKAPAGAVVVLDVHDGSVLAMASSPSFPPSRWVGGISQADFSALNDPAGYYPLLNRATEGQYAPGSSFKLVASVASSQYGLRGAYEPYNDTGSVFIGNQWFYNDNHAVNHSVDLARALTVSSDTYFYTIGNSFWGTWHGGDAQNGLGLQTVAREFGFGSPTGIEIDEARGRVPDPTWKQSFANASYKTAFDREQNGAWYPGDEVHLAVGQGDVLVTPLQLANAYACFANGGTLETPHLGLSINDGKKVLRFISPKSRGGVSIPAAVRAQMLAGFEGAVQNSSGTAYPAFQGDPLAPNVAGKTGTAQVNGKGPTSVFASFFPANNPEYVVVALVEQGGYGAQTAAPIARQVIDAIANPNSTGSAVAPINLPTSGKD
ncbi:MAG TPA: penicillin-binding protein 2 [Acidimicrobiia bacterium]|nr:penicillin-binding protein 2 [Acidimicrobiia bacterium]